MEVLMVTSGFEKSPWVFKGSAVYQIHSVRADSVRPFIPNEFRIFQNFGYTIGGFFLANYEESPFGAFDELVVIAGIVKTDRSSRAWAAKVLVSSDEARDHGRKVFGLPSQVANFTKTTTTVMPPQTNERKSRGFLNINGLGIPTFPKNYNDIQIREVQDEGSTNSWNLSISSAAPNLNINRFMISPQIKLSLTSLSGLTEYNPHLLEYTCEIETSINLFVIYRVRAIATAKISDELAPQSEEESELQKCHHQMESRNMRNLMIETVLKQSKPIIALEFNSMKMTVDSPTIVSPIANTQ